MNNKDNIKSCVNHYSRPEWERWTGSNICPRCCSDEIEYNTQLILTSNPPKVQLRCKKCDFYFTSSFESDLIDKDALDKVYEEVKKSFGIPEIRDPLPGEIPYIGDWPPGPTITDPMPGTDNWIPYKPVPNESNKAIMYGWVCPKCGKVNAPHRDFCDCSGNHNPNIVYCNGTGSNPNPAPSITIFSNTTKENNNGNL